jgi:hypothetical protein
MVQRLYKKKLAREKAKKEKDRTAAIKRMAGARPDSAIRIVQI